MIGRLRMDILLRRRRNRRPPISLQTSAPPLRNTIILRRKRRRPHNEGLILLAGSAKLLRAPEGRWKLAGGGAKRSHRDRSKKIVRVPAGTLDRNSQQDQSRSDARALVVDS